MSQRDYDLDMEFEDEPIDVERPERAGGVISVRFNPDEMWELREETRVTGERVGTLIRESTLAVIRSRRADRQLTTPTLQSPGAELEAFWWHPHSWSNTYASFGSPLRSLASFDLAIDSLSPENHLVLSKWDTTSAR